ncbi:TPR repeat/tetratricopeptide repeat, putative [Leishmania tarentolae]|uniref:TPR repeat/tetratricopeptide repeat, putative n=1 Tax=Leishmania tarentolae TaxID=5689 RepID=A0A640K7F7_LEITA|nr:TPR repeat/tetratricopeptide repeat, putative [Leishmania tarentolae]
MCCCFHLFPPWLLFPALQPRPHHRLPSSLFSASQQCPHPAYIPRSTHTHTHTHTHRTFSAHPPSLPPSPFHMSTEADRQAFLRLMGLTDADVADPDHQPCPTLHPSTSSSRHVAEKVHRRAQHSSPTASSVAGLSYSASLGGDAIQLSLMNTTSTLRDTTTSGASGPPSSSRPLVSARRSVHWEDENIATTSNASPLPQRRGAPGCTAAAISEELKDKGNRSFEAGAFREAAEHYTAAINALAASTTHSGAEVMLLGALYSNRSAAYLQSAHEMPSAEDAYARALCDADRAVSLRSSWFKGYARQGDAYFKLRQYGAAAEAYEMALQMDPRNKTLMNALSESRQRARHAAREALELRRTMLSTTTGQAGSSTSAKGDPCGGAAASQKVSTQSDVYKGGRRRSGQTQRLWAALKQEVEASVHEATGDAYRLQQLERFRARCSKEVTPTAQRAAERKAHVGNTVASSSGAPAFEPVKKASAAVSRCSAAPRPDAEVNPATAAASVERRHLTSVSSCSATALPSEPHLPPHRSAPVSPAASGHGAAGALFDGPVKNVRDVPYAFSSAAASAYQQRLLEEFRRRKATKQ